MFNLSDRVFIVTGATGNLGQAVTRKLQSAGAKLVLVDRSAEEHFAEVFPDLANVPECVFAHTTDLMDPDAVAHLVAHVLAVFGQVNGLINIVGGYQAGEPVHETDLETLNFMFNLNVRTVFLTSKAVIPSMIANGGGKIVNIGARVAFGGTRNHGAYSAAKTAVVRLTESMAAEVKTAGINVNAVLPGTIDTPANRAAMPDAKFDRWVTPDALADAILFLCSDTARAVHGVALPVYGLT